MARRPVVADRVAATLGALLILVYALMSGIGGPPSEFTQHPPWLADLLFDRLFGFYAAGAVLALAGLVSGAFHATWSRWSSTVGGVSISVGNLVCAGIGAGNNAHAAFILGVIVIPLLLTVWVPHMLRRRDRQASPRGSR